MTIRIGRTLPPAAAPIPLKDILQALPSCLSNETGGFSFEKELKQEFGQRYCLLVSSGTAALVLILKALHTLYPERDEVLIPAFTCYSVPAAIKKAGLKIKLCDTGPDTLDFDKNQLRKIIEADNSGKTILCVLVTHLFGCAADFAGIKKIIGDTIPIVEDAAQAMGGEIGNKKMGTLGDVGFFSLGRGKALSTTEGGVIVSSWKSLGDELSNLLNTTEIYSFFDKMKLVIKTIFTTLLQHPLLFSLPKNLPFLRLGETIYKEKISINRMSSFQKRLACNWLKRLQRHQKARRKNSSFWQQALPQNLSPICSIQELTSPIRFPVLASSAEERDRICLKSESLGCGVMPAYPRPINEIPQVSGGFTGQHFPNAKKLAKCLMTLPVHEYVREIDRIRIQTLLNE